VTRGGRAVRRGESLCDLDGLGAGDVTEILDAAESMAEVLARPIPRVPALRGRTVMLLFFEPSTRTRHSFELACKALGADPLSLAAATSSAAKGESLRDSLRTAAAMGADAVVLRHPQSGAARYAADLGLLPVLNAGDGTHAHPTQALLDLFAVRRRAGTLSGLRLTVVGDVLHSRVARSTAAAFVKMGSRVTLCGPPPLVPPAAGPALGAEVQPDLGAALRGADVVLLLRLQHERTAGTPLPAAGEYRRGWGVDAERLRRHCPGALVLHPGPVNRGAELLDDVLDLPQTLVQDQVAAGVAVRMALLYRMLEGGREPA
jgi:aspartate carbamoyltransferase catalytic subunit